MDEKSTATVPSLGYRNNAIGRIAGIKHAHLSFVHKRVPIHELQ
jgi:hypothetical protein